jgi:alpha-tubulin suppressor-like RCC1 family protein
MNCGYYSTIIHTEQGITATGCNYSGELLIDEGIVQEFTLVNDTIGVEIMELGNHCSYIIDYNGNLYSLGYDTSAHYKKKLSDIANSKISGIKDAYMVKAGYEHVVIATKTGVYTYGCNKYGQLGRRTYSGDYDIVPIKINIPCNVSMIACGNYHTVIYADEKLYTFGWNVQGQLGNDSRKSTWCPEIIYYFGGITAIACGSMYTLVLMSDNDVYGCGENDEGQLGLSDTDARSSLTKITSNIAAIACGNNHTVMLSLDNKIYSCGANENGQAGHNDGIARLVPTEIDSANNANIINIACGAVHTVAINEDGDVYGFGNNEYY